MFALVLSRGQHQALVAALPDPPQCDLRFGNAVLLPLLLLPPLQHAEDALLIGQALAQILGDRLEEVPRVVVHLRRLRLVLQIAVSRQLVGILEDRPLCSFRNEAIKSVASNTDSDRIREIR